MTAYFIRKEKPRKFREQFRGDCLRDANRMLARFPFDPVDRAAMRVAEENVMGGLGYAPDTAPHERK